MASDSELAAWVLGRVHEARREAAGAAELVVLAHRCGVLRTPPSARMRALACAWRDAPPAECRQELEEQYRRAADDAAAEVRHG